MTAFLVAIRIKHKSKTATSMKKKYIRPLPIVLAAALVSSVAPLSASSLLLNFHTTHANDPGVVAGDYLDLSPGHATNSIPSGETTWNNFNTLTPGSSLSKSDGTAATGAVVSFGREGTPGNGIISYSATNINTTALYGTGGGASGIENYLSNAGSIYGDGNNTLNSAPGRTGWLGGAGDTAIGLRVDGLLAGSYSIFVMGRNTNSTASGAAMTFFASAGEISPNYDFSALTGSVTSPSIVAQPDPTAYNEFIAGDNYTMLNVTIADGQSLYLASDGSGNETRGFLNMLQIVPIPEPSTALLSVCGVFALLRRRRA